MLEEGWAITRNDFYIIMESIDIDLQINGQVKGLIKILRKSLQIKKEEYITWLKERGAVFPPARRSLTATEAASPRLFETLF